MKTFINTFLLIAFCSITLSGQIVINEIIPPNTVEIRNLGAATVNISSYTLCQFPSYNQLSNITQVCGGDLMIEGGSMIAVNVTFNLSANDDELALYIMNGSFENPANIVDYVEWGSTGHVRSTVAVAAGIWSSGDFVPSFTGCASLEYDGTGNSSTDWVSQDMATTPCLTNTLDGCAGSNCDIAGAGLSNVACDDNGTPSNPNDDFISFNLNPTGVDLASEYSVTVSSGSIFPTNANYGSPTSFQLQNGSAGDGNVTVTIIDNDDPSCTFLVVITDPGSCSELCDLTGTGLSGVFCNDAGTPTSGTDDFIMFNLNPTGLNLGSQYLVSVSSGSVSPTSANYGSLTTFDLNTGSAGNGNVTVTITDGADGACTITALIVDPGTCSDDCDLISGGLTDVACDDNGTSSDADDVITFSLNPTGVNLSSGYNVSVSNGSINPSSASYGGIEDFTLNAGSAGGGNVTVTITDQNDLACDIDVIINDPGSCSESCNLFSGGLTGVVCDDNGTSTDPADDFIVFNLNPTGANLGATYNVTVSSGTILPASGAYGAPVQFSLNSGSAGGGNVTVTITDASDPACTIDVIITDPGPCAAGTCDLTDPGLSAILCSDNGTPIDPSDDFISFTINPAGVNLGATYHVSVDTGTVNPMSGTYGSATTFDMNTGSAGGGNVTVTLTDATDTLCTLMFTFADPGTCSDACNLTDAGLSAVICNANGTPDDSDDFIGFSLNPIGTGLSGGYTVSVSSGTVSPDTASYGAATLFVLNSGSAGDGDVTVTITDLDDPTCTINVVVTDPGTCSEMCNLTSSGLGNVVCNDNSTPDDADDFIAFTLNPAGTLLGTGYTVSVSAGTVTPTSGTYGMSTSFNLNSGSAGGGVVTVTITDATDPLCDLTIVVSDPGTCSEPPCEVSACDISTNSERMICVDDGVQDSIVVICNPSTIGMSSAWVLTDTTGVIQSVTASSDTAIFIFEGQPSGVCLIWLVAWDGTLNGLTVGQDLDTLSGCFDVSNPLVVTKLTGTECESSTFNPGLSELITLYPIPVSGMLQIDARDVIIHRITILNVIGRTMFRLDQINPNSIDMQSLDMGLYYVMLETNLGWNLQRIVVGR